MAGHSHFANIKYKKAAQDAKKAKAFTKAVREIAIAARSGCDINLNSALKIAVAKARAINLPKERIEAAIKTHQNVNTNYEYVRYNASLSSGITLIIEVETENKNRTVAEVRHILTKHGGNLLESGSIEFMFLRIGRIVYNTAICNNEKMFEIAVECGANNVEETEEYYIIETEHTKLHHIATSIALQLGEAASVEIIWKANEYINIVNTETLHNITNCIEKLEQIDDIDNVFSNLLM